MFQVDIDNINPCLNRLSEMKNVYSAPHLFMVHHCKNILSSHGIASMVKNEYLSGGAGELPPTECWPILCVDDDDAERAEALLRQALSDESQNKSPWRCPRCGEVIEPQFEWCWNCGFSEETVPQNE